MTKLIYNARHDRIEAKDGRKVLFHASAKGLTQTAISALIEAADPETVTEADLLAVIEAQLARKASVIPNHYREQYGVDQNCGDAVAKTLTGLVTDPKEGVDLDKCRDVAKANDVEDRFDGWMVKGLNPGMVRMNLGNVLRGKARRGEPVTIGERTFNAE